MSLLDDLKRQAEEIAARNQSDAARLAENAALIEPRMHRLFLYLNEAANALNVIQPIVPQPVYLEPSVGLTGLQAKAFFLEPRRKRLLEREVYDHIALSFRYQGSEPLEVKKDFHQVDEFRNLLVDNGVVFEIQEFRNERARTTHAVFQVEPTVRANLRFEARHAEGTIRCRAKNIGRLGVVERDFSPHLIDETLLDDIVKRMLGQGHAPTLFLA